MRRSRADRRSPASDSRSRRDRPLDGRLGAGRVRAARGHRRGRRRPLRRGEPGGRDARRQPSSAGRPDRRARAADAGTPRRHGRGPLRGVARPHARAQRRLHHPAQVAHQVGAPDVPAAISDLVQARSTSLCPSTRWARHARSGSSSSGWPRSWAGRRGRRSAHARRIAGEPDRAARRARAWRPRMRGPTGWTAASRCSRRRRRTTPSSGASRCSV